MTEQQFDELFASRAHMWDLYVEYIMDNADDELSICNGDDVLEAAEAGFLYEDFRDHWIAANAK
jgi:hypothetical protein